MANLTGSSGLGVPAPVLNTKPRGWYINCENRSRDLCGSSETHSDKRVRRYRYPAISTVDLRQAERAVVRGERLLKVVPMLLAAQLSWLKVD